MNNGIMRSCLAMAMAVSLAGCSFFAVTAPSDTSGATEPNCNEESDSPWLDGVAAGSFVLPTVIAALMAADCSGESSECMDVKLGMVGAGLSALVFAASGVSGSGKLKKCRRAHDNWRLRLQNPEPVLEPTPSVHPPGMNVRPPSAPPAPAAPPAPVTRPPAPAAPPAPAIQPPAPVAPPAPPAATPLPTAPPAGTEPPPTAPSGTDFWKKKDS